MALLEWTADGVTTALEIDVAEREGYESTAEVTDKAVERGAPIADHVRPGSDSFTVEGLISNTPIVVPRSGLGGATGSTRRADVTVGGVTLAASALQWSAPFDRARACDELFRRLVETSQLVSYTGSLRQSDDCVLTRYSVDRDASTGSDLPVTLELKKLHLVSTQRVAVPRAAQRRGQSAGNRGAQAATPATARNESAALTAARRAGIRLPGDR